MKYLLVFLVLIGGAGIPIQAAANKRMSEAVQSPALSVTLAFAIGTLVMLALTLSGAMGRGQIGAAMQTPWWAWIGGVLSAFVVVVSLVGVKQDGAGGIIAGTVFGQLACALLLDHFGWLGVKQSPANAYRIAGLIFMCIGALLMQKKS